MITRLAGNLNGISVAYVMGLVNAIFACLIAFGLSLTDEEIGALATLINASLILAIHFGHRVGEATASGQAQALSTRRTDASVHEAEKPPDNGPPAPTAG